MEESGLLKKKSCLKRELCDTFVSRGEEKHVTFVCAEEAFIKDKTPTVPDEEIGQCVAKKRSVPLKMYCGSSIEAQIFGELVTRYLKLGGVTSCDAFIELYISCIDKVSAFVNREFILKDTVHTVFDFVSDLKERMSQDGSIFPILMSGGCTVKIPKMSKPNIDHLHEVMIQTINKTTLIEKYTDRTTAVSDFDPLTLIESGIEHVSIVNEVDPSTLVDDDGDLSVIHTIRTDSTLLF
jgi:hypothetical protein